MLFPYILNRAYQYRRDSKRNPGGFQYPNIAAGVIPKVAQSKRAIFSVGSALPET